MSNNLNYTQQLAQFASEQNFDDRYLQCFDSIYQQAGIKDVSKMTYADADRIIQVLSASQASVEFIKGFCATVATQMPPSVLEYFLSSDTDGDGRTLAQEIFLDDTNPFEPDFPNPQFSTTTISQDFDYEL